MDRGTFIALTSAFAAAPTSAPPSRTIWLPMAVGMNRCFVSLAVSDAHGRTRTGVFWLDTGGGNLILQRDFARELGLRPTGAGVNEGGQRYIPTESPRISIGGVDVPLAPNDTMMLDAEAFVGGVDAQGLFPVRLLRDHAVTFDYPARRFGLDVGGLGGDSVPLEIASRTGFARMPISIDGEQVYVLLDTGASCTMLSQSLIDHLRSVHRDWRWVRGAYGDANMVGGALEASAEMLLVPNLSVGTTMLSEVAVVSRPPNTFEKWMSELTAGPIVGSLAGNVLRNFRVTLDYPNARAVFEPSVTNHPHIWDLVPLTLTPAADGTYTISGVLDIPPFAAARTKLVGAGLVSIDSMAVTGRRMTDVHNLLRGVPGTEKHIVVARGSSTQGFDLPVIPLWNHG